ncbi:hypothetical protein MO867_08380 [Microbulbifer sp. OS29]|uniref:DUF2946 domain-containing protein n=1 Tax=Microbulbifer okhotskensis TaxID=2926617 RepID=A0A9X2ENE7_9GAMM|nr:hypothetical protein [Microbulbifer okhotskensis]MCO1334355.1 hypothetical protein [Microbulbifer okhotskensis]
MNVVRLSFLLIALLVFQTAGAFYDSHEELQDVTSHLSLHHVDQEGSSGHPWPDDQGNPLTDVDIQGTQIEGEPGQSAPLLDFCNHCCHCHGSSLTGLLGQSFQPIQLGSISYRDLANVAVPSGYFSPLLRPPITQV